MPFNVMKFFQLFDPFKYQSEHSECFKRRWTQDSANYDPLKNKKLVYNYMFDNRFQEKRSFPEKNLNQLYHGLKNQEILIRKSENQDLSIESSYRKLDLQKNPDSHKSVFLIDSNEQKHFTSFPVRLPKATPTGRQLFENAFKKHSEIISPKRPDILKHISSRKSSLFYNIHDFQTPFTKKRHYSLESTNFYKSIDSEIRSPNLYSMEVFKNQDLQNFSKTKDLFLSSSINSHVSQKRSSNSYYLSLDTKELQNKTKNTYDFQKYQFMNDNESLDELIKQLKEQYKDERLYNWNNLQKEKQERDDEIQKLKDLSIQHSSKLPPLSKELLKKVDDVLFSNKIKDPLIVKFNISITSHDIRTLRDKEWLNDEIINFYIALVSERAKASPKGPKVYAFNTFFYTTLEKKGYQGVRRWTKRAKVDIMQQDYVLIPIHLGIHWCMSVINFKKKRFEYWDSLNGSSGNIFNLLRDYLLQESGNTIDLDKWYNYIPEFGPVQKNGYDCGVFACKTAECIAREVSVDYTQDDIKELRKRMVANIIEGRIF
ncbi:hypothetical protein PCANB_001562 [Pneumocystis canis]|nr:hypothetical protein PCANB_001562 [Pneumocystis canis]